MDWGTGASAISSTFFSSGDGGGSVWCCCGGCLVVLCVLKNALLCYFLLLLLLCCYVLRPEDIYYIQPFKPKGKEGCKQDTHQSVFCHRDTLLLLLRQGRDPLLALLHLLPFKSFWGFLSFYDGLTHIGKKERGDMTLYISIPVCVCVWRILYGRQRHLSLSIVFCVCVRLLGCCNQFSFFFKRDDPQNNKTI